MIDTQVAYPRIGSEEGGIGPAIAMNLMDMSRLRGTLVCGVIGVRGGGARPI